MCASRFFAEPLKYFFSTLGEAMRLFLKELPVQWQPIGFLTVIILFIVLVIIFSGFEISSPLLRIGVGQQARFELKQKENELLQFKAEKENLENNMKEYELNMKQLEKNKDLLKQRLKTIEENRLTRQIGISNHGNYGSTGIPHVGVRNTQTQGRERSIYSDNIIIEGIDHLQIDESNVSTPPIGYSNRNLLLMDERNNRQPVEHDDIGGEVDTHNIVNRQQSPVTSIEHSDNEHSTESEQNSEPDPETIQASSMYESGYVLVEGHETQG